MEVELSVQTMERRFKTLHQSEYIHFVSYFSLLLTEYLLGYLDLRGEKIFPLKINITVILHHQCYMDSHTEIKFWWLTAGHG